MSGFLLFFKGSATFIALCYLSQLWSKGTSRQLVQSNMVIAWACRLGLFSTGILVKISAIGPDGRGNTNFLNYEI